MMRLRRLEIALGLTLGAALIASLGIIIHQSRRLAVLERQQATDQQSLRELREALRQRDLQNTPAEAESRTPPSDQQAALAKRDAAIERLNQELDDAHARITGLQAQLSNSSDEQEKALASANEGYRKEREDWQSRLDALKQELDSAEAESEASRQRILALEADNAKLKSDNKESSARAAELGRVAADLEDVDRRRDPYLTSIMRRYRDLTAQFRAMSGMLDSSRDPNASAFGSEELTRIQNAVSLADDDLRQLNELNARALQLEKKLVKK
jgi:chromosome segregation ATPase